PRSADRAVQALSTLRGGEDIEWCTCSAPMGENVLAAAGIGRSTVLYHPTVPTGAADTKAACRAFLAAGVDLIVFCGGDGTARDVFDAVCGGYPDPRHPPRGGEDVLGGLRGQSGGGGRPHPPGGRDPPLPGLRGDGYR
ncbi:NAD(+)/NADH kinase, partial [Methanoculleus chikugoensis]|uniref:NAD(+)/NADH kinase n=1 Tax=Methanoculleus chikugoensis TaxID=118126 RepID=UPI001FB2BB04